MCVGIRRPNSGDVFGFSPLALAEGPDFLTDTVKLEDISFPRNGGGNAAVRPVKVKAENGYSALTTALQLLQLPGFLQGAQGTPFGIKSGGPSPY